MKAHAIIVNTSRGPLIDEIALVEALRQKRIGAAALDVFEEEPLPPSSPLLKLENVVLTPHIAGYSDLFLDSFWRYSVETLIALAQGYWPRSVVNPEVIPKWKLPRRNGRLSRKAANNLQKRATRQVPRAKPGRNPKVTSPATRGKRPMRLGATINSYFDDSDPQSYVAECQRWGYRAAPCRVSR